MSTESRQQRTIDAALALLDDAAASSLISAVTFRKIGATLGQHPNTAKSAFSPEGGRAELLNNIAVTDSLVDHMINLPNSLSSLANLSRGGPTPDTVEAMRSIWVDCLTECVNDVRNSRRILLFLAAALSSGQEGGLHEKAKTKSQALDLAYLETDVQTRFASAIQAFHQQHVASLEHGLSQLLSSWKRDLRDPMTTQSLAFNLASIAEGTVLQLLADRSIDTATTIEQCSHACVALIASATRSPHDERSLSNANTDEILASAPIDRVQGPFEAPVGTYRQAARMITETEPDSAHDKLLLLSSLHGHHGPRLAIEDETESMGFKSERIAFGTAIANRLEQGWRLRHVMTFVDESRLDSFLHVLASLPAHCRMEVRGALHDDQLPALSMLVVGRKATSIASDNDQMYGPGASIHLQDQQVARWAEDHFDQIWDATPATIWTPAGPNTAVIEQLRASVT